jgi:cytochrome c oxidase accessory protein FixG
MTTGTDVRPQRERLSTIRSDGSRRRVHPADVRGRFTLWRRLVAVLLIAVYVLLPWIPVGGHPAVLLNVMKGRFHIFGMTFATQDLWLVFFLITGLAFSLYYVSALFGRVWCGWACPYTVFLEHVYRRIERVIDGDALARRRAEKRPLDGPLLARRLVKHAAYFLASLIIAHVFLSYFVPLPELWSMVIHRPAEHKLAFGVVVALTLLLHGAFAWFREQFCIVLCPYGRMQSVLSDENTIQISYDAGRGEPRGKPGRAGVGDCIDCLRCVQVCPTGIDIRHGHQIECIGCANCIDACDAVMTKLTRPRGLIRYASQNALGGRRTKWVRPRTLLYTGLMGIGCAVLALSLTRVSSLEVGVTRLPGMPYYVDASARTVRNQFQVRVINKRETAATLGFELIDPPAGTRITGPGDYRVGPLDESMAAVTVTVPWESYRGSHDLKLGIRRDARVLLTRKIRFAGPEPELLQKAFEEGGREQGRAN